MLTEFDNETEHGKQVCVICELDLGILKVYLYTMNFLGYRFQKLEPYRHADRCSRKRTGFVQILEKCGKSWNLM